jgi:hypothetical protein
MSTLGEEDPLDPNNPMSYAPRWMREEARSRSIASNETKPELPERSVTSPSSFDTFSEAVSKSLRNRLDPEVMHEPPALSQWRELIPVAVRFAAAVGVSTLVALFFVFMIPASRDRVQDHVQDHAQDHAQDSNAYGATEAVKTALTTQAPREGESKPAESKPVESKSSLAQFETILTADRTEQPADPAKTHDVTHEQSEELLHQFVRWQQKLDSTDAPPQ